ncbi:MAG: DUF5615 family PIN-like protein [Candidatus Acidiferrales bacterium]
MNVLFDANVPRQLRRLLRNHTISTAQEQKWGNIDNGKLLRAAEAADFEVLVTCDKNIVYQQNLKRRKIALVVLSTNDWSILRKAGPLVGAALDAARPRSFQMVDLQCSAP